MELLEYTVMALVGVLATKRLILYLSGYICAQGHVFWLEWAWPAPPGTAHVVVRKISKTPEQAS